MALTNTFVTSVNGKIGSTPYEIDYVKQKDDQNNYTVITGPSSPPFRVIFVDAADFRMEGTTGKTMLKEIQDVLEMIHPLLFEKIGDTEDYIMRIEADIPYNPIV